MAAALQTVGGQEPFLLHASVIITSQVKPSHWCFDVSDYELQVSLSEALCRLTPRKERDHRARQWFSSCDLGAAFCDITDKDFEVVSGQSVSGSALEPSDPPRPSLRTVAGSSTLSTVSTVTTGGGWRFFNHVKPKGVGLIGCCVVCARVHTFPCRAAFLGSTQVKPASACPPRSLRLNHASPAAVSPQR